MKQVSIIAGIIIFLLSSCGSDNTYTENDIELQAYNVDSQKTILGTIVSGDISKKREGELILVTDKIRSGSVDTIILGKGGFYEVETQIFRKMSAANDQSHKIKAEFTVNNSDSRLFQYPNQNKFILRRDCGCEEINFKW